MLVLAIKFSRIDAVKPEHLDKTVKVSVLRGERPTIMASPRSLSLPQNERTRV